MKSFSTQWFFFGKTSDLWHTLEKHWVFPFYKKIKVIGIAVVTFYITNVSLYAAIGMANPFSFQVDGLDFSQNTTPDEKTAWAALVDKGMNKIQAARYILTQKAKTKI